MSGQIIIRHDKLTQLIWISSSSSATHCLLPVFHLEANGILFFSLTVKLKNNLIDKRLAGENLIINIFPSTENVVKPNDKSSGLVSTTEYRSMIVFFSLSDNNKNN